MKTKKVWAIFYRIRVNSNSKWCKWVGPCGVFLLGFPSSKVLTDILRGRPFFFRTRKQAREMAKELDQKSNITWTWVQHTVRPMKLTYEEIK